MHRSIPALVVTAAIAVPIAGCSTSQASLPQAQPTATAAPAPQQTAAPLQSGTMRTIQGLSEDMRWGPVQVTLTVEGKQIVDVQATAPTERERSAYINNQAIPMLRQEVLQAQSANIDGISGATMTSEAFYASLQTALQQAGI